MQTGPLEPDVTTASLVCYIDGEPRCVDSEIVQFDPIVVRCPRASLHDVPQSGRIMAIIGEGYDPKRVDFHVNRVWTEDGATLIEGRNASWSTVDRRRFPRYELRIPLSLRVVSSEADGIKMKEWHGETIDISMGGAWLSGDVDVNKGTLVQTQIQLGGSEPLRVLSMVAWKEDDRSSFGITFLDFIGAGSYVLHQYLNTAA
ncbi:MAG: PilZ domain-containing protein [Armatimonadetes bacterium]|uniref:PilZ domain protein n=1 Tax=Candidatus Nitrosymbiomonas proteolyticus TaxID=2608984 RepID=A0A809S4Z1_9BACT|nr:MAG: PilZ domain-containing protein [Armatimonadota bacterium]KXK17782.1 MAG: PilZ domain protein [Armatimonadetes bacterium OLB18]MCK6632858.1 PilZ domain-containing protein [Fimbriimonadaceae bacterium]BBO23917.1 PilZ domain protein [Candidatus Nitrosymbiomonas proteolyticus]MBL1151836.1 PilZ domain-containing protein [Armatimonadota bacterium]